jgi:hypothetical protein
VCAFDLDLLDRKTPFLVLYRYFTVAAIPYDLPRPKRRAISLFNLGQVATISIQNKRKRKTKCQK